MLVLQMSYTLGPLVHGQKKNGRKQAESVCLALTILIATYCHPYCHPIATLTFYYCCLGIPHVISSNFSYFQQYFRCNIARGYDSTRLLLGDAESSMPSVQARSTSDYWSRKQKQKCLRGDCCYCCASLRRWTAMQEARKEKSRSSWIRDRRRCRLWRKTRLPLRCWQWKLSFGYLKVR